VGAGVGMGMHLAAVTVAVAAKWGVVEDGVHAGKVRAGCARLLDDGALENDADDAGGGHDVDDGQFAVPAL
jgi:hypothetical protein